jgi:hypothetical protein
MNKIDFKKQLAHLYKTSAKQIVCVDVPAMNFLMIDGKGDPGNSTEYSQALEALYGVSYTLKFATKKGALAVDYGVLPLEGLWWADDMDVFVSGDKSQWQWTMMIMQPDFVTKAMVEEAVKTVKIKKNPAALPLLRFEEFKEGLCAQTLHIGPFSEEGPTIQRVPDFIDENGNLRGKHHEIYLSDIRRAAPAKWKTVIRQPMNPSNSGN